MQRRNTVSFWMRGMLVFPVFALALAPFSMAASSVAAVSAEEQVVVVFDASGSMWGQVQGRTKIEIARDAMGSLVKRLEGRSVNMGLIVYGHRRKGDCADIELIHPVSRLDTGTVLNRVNALSPKGMTPLSQAVRNAAELMNYSEQKATVILLSDGVETCKLDPCMIGAELEAKGVNFTAHVIGFNIRTEQDKAQLACLAKATGGKYFDARDTDGLAAAMDQAGQATLDSKPSSAATPKLQLSVNSPVAVAGRVEAQWKGKNGPDDMVVIVEKGKPSTPSNRIVVVHVTKNPARLNAPNLPGDYDVVYVVDAYNRSVEAARVALKVVESAVTLIPEGKAYAASHLSVAWKGPTGEDKRIVVVPEGAPINPSTVLAVAEASGEKVTLKMPPKAGIYELAYVGSYHGKPDVMLRQPLSVEAYPVELDVPVAVTPGKPFAMSWQGPSGGDERIAIVKRGSAVNPSTVLSLAWVEKEDVIELQAPENSGEYDVVFVSDYYHRADVLTRVPLTVR